MRAFASFVRSFVRDGSAGRIESFGGRSSRARLDTGTSGRRDGSIRVESSRFCDLI